MFTIRTYFIPVAAVFFATAYVAPANAILPIKVERETTNTQVVAGAYYTQIRGEVPELKLTLDDSGRKQLGKAFLQALGLGTKTKSVTVTLAISTSNSVLPDYPLISYSFDEKRRISDIKTVGTFSSPLWRLDPNEPIKVQLKYRYSESSSFDVRLAIDSIASIMPSSALISEESKPLVNNITNLANNILTLANTRTVTESQTEDMRPYANDQGARVITFTLFSPTAQSLGTVKLSLFSSPTLLRPTSSVFSAASSDFIKLPQESPSDTALMIAGVKKYALTEIEGMPEYLTAGKEKTVPTVQAFCQKAAGFLRKDYSLTPMDRNLVVYEATKAAGLKAQGETNDNSWYFSCFDDTDRLALKNAISLNPDPYRPPPPDTTAIWPVSFKDAVGCWLIGSSGPFCAAKVPNIRSALEAAMSDTIKIGIIDLKSIDTGDLPESRLWPRSTLLDRISSKASSFACYQKGLVITADDGAKSYLVSATLVDGKIASISILHADDDAIACRDH